MNRGWFWWGEKEQMPQLWDALYDELVIRQKLDNLIWVWAMDREAPSSKAFFPIRHKPDVVGTDMYEPDQNTPKYARARSDLTALGGSAPFAITEVGLVPSAKVLDAVNPAWVLLWGDMVNVNWTWNGDCPTCNKPEQVAAFFKLDRVVTLDRVPGGLRQTLASGVTNAHPLHKASPSCPARLR
jgi:mannan endo-1,4-beta-mannosidase